MIKNLDLGIIGGTLNSKIKFTEWLKTPMLTLSSWGKFYGIILLNGNIESLEMVTTDTQIKSNNSSGLGGAIAGGLLFGGVGAIVGSNVDKKTQIKSKTEICFKCILKTGDWFISKADIGVYQKLYVCKETPATPPPDRIQKIINIIDKENALDSEPEVASTDILQGTLLEGEESGENVAMRIFAMVASVMLCTAFLTLIIDTVMNVENKRLLAFICSLIATIVLGYLNSRKEESAAPQIATCIFIVFIMGIIAI